ncbi:YveK family protein [Planococcus shixiaomingii]|uniref:YveK family protein n=1 Tax=Planococcus shixiaomingii TaxID=3058393 RepID=UPI00262CB1D9|nr:Wzz/FepE/Etk N-terminal domain-containing protein [Planococcus sp. N022]WKA53960.1 Wzz/FepE/Etk N-terminal domain-containing protein [Planococcus sp. N022]
MEETLDLRSLFNILRQRVVLILAVILLVTGLTAVISLYLLTPIYENSSQILVNQEEAIGGNLAIVNVERDRQLLNTYSVIISSPVILEQVIENLNLDTSLKELNKKITITSTSESQVIGISARDENPETAAKIVNTIATVFEKDIQEVMKIDNITILSTATAKEDQLPVSPNLWINLAIASAAGLLLGVGLALLLDYLDTSVKSQRDVKRLLNVPVIAVISPIEQSGKLPEKAKLALEEKEA